MIRIVSGGQTGVDRGALDAALAAGVPCGGWCPPGRRAEDGVIPARYPVHELTQGGYRQRTLRNVLDSDGTIVFYFGYVEGGTEQTLLDCIHNQRPYKLIDGNEIAQQRGAVLVAEFVHVWRLSVINVAGPRGSKMPRGYDYVFRVMKTFLDECSIPGS